MTTPVIIYVKLAFGVTVKTVLLVKIPVRPVQVTLNATHVIDLPQEKMQVNKVSY
jgi:hypothetical protein